MGSAKAQKNGVVQRRKHRQRRHWELNEHIVGALCSGINDAHQNWDEQEAEGEKTLKILKILGFLSNRENFQNQINFLILEKCKNPLIFEL